MPSGIMLSPVYCLMRSQIRSMRLSAKLRTHEFVILEVGYNLLGERLCSLLEDFDALGIRFLKLRLDGLHVSLCKRGIISGSSRTRRLMLSCLEEAQIGLFVKGGGLETERVGDVVDLGRALLQGLLLFLRRRVGA